MIRSFAQALSILVLFVPAAGAQEVVFVGDVPLPEYAVSYGEADSPFSGTWVGQYEDGKHHILIVENLGDDGSVEVVYAVGNDLNSPGRWFRREAKIDGDRLVFVDDGFPVRYTISGSGRMRAVFSDNKGFAILERQELADLLASPDEDWFSIGQLEFLETDLIEDGKAIRLAAVVYRPAGEGPFPLALVHHGSTGWGNNPAAFEQVWFNDWFADVLNAKGWLVAYPQRRGRGGSDGLYDEGFSEDRSQGYSQMPELSLPGAERALIDANAALAALRKWPEVDDGKVLLGGMSRGGVVAILQAGYDPQAFSGVINFVGGWVNGRLGDPTINPTLFSRIGAFDGPVLSIYGESDPFYSIDHSRSNVAEMEKIGTDSQFHVVKPTSFGSGHWVMFMPYLWDEIVDEFLASLE